MSKTSYVMMTWPGPDEAGYAVPNASCACVTAQRGRNTPFLRGVSYRVASLMAQLPPMRV